tara:strand:- start:389 stop:544 length:156 start_codon:yes stop_codon:yes gene_type:complete
MNDEFTPNNIDIENDVFNINTEDSDFKNLIIRLKGISKTISLLEKKYLDKF